MGSAQRQHGDPLGGHQVRGEITDLADGTPQLIPRHAGLGFRPEQQVQAAAATGDLHRRRPQPRLGGPRGQCNGE